MKLAKVLAAVIISGITLMSFGVVGLVLSLAFR